MMTMMELITETKDPWLAIHYAYGTPIIREHPSKAAAHDDIQMTHGIKTGGKRMGDHYEYGGRHIIAKKSVVKKMGYEESVQMKTFRLFITDSQLNCRCPAFITATCTETPCLRKTVIKETEQ